MTLMMTMPVQLKQRLTASPLLMGVVCAIVSNVLFGVIYAYGKWLVPLTGTDVFLWRMLMMWLCLVVLLVMTGKIKNVLADLIAIKGIKSWLYLLIPTPIFASQLWLFMWAPLNGQGVQVSMGYFLFPLVMVLAGSLMGDKLSKLQWLAVALAGVGVLMEIGRTGQISLATFWVCLTYPVYYIIRRKQKVRALTGLFVDTSIIAPVCLVWLLWSGQSQGFGLVATSIIMLAKVVGLGLISVLALQSNLDANRLLPTSLFGMMGYLEPALLFVLAVTFLGGSFSPDMLLSFGLIWAGIACLLVQGVLGRRV